VAPLCIHRERDLTFVANTRVSTFLTGRSLAALRSRTTAQPHRSRFRPSSARCPCAPALSPESPQPSFRHRLLRLLAERAPNSAARLAPGLRLRTSLHHPGRFHRRRGRSLRYRYRHRHQPARYRHRHPSCRWKRCCPSWPSCWCCGATARKAAAAHCHRPCVLCCAPHNHQHHPHNHR